MKFGSRYVLRETVGTKFENPSLTQQAFKEETDINNIVRRYSETGYIQPVTKDMFYDDVSEIPTDFAGYTNYIENVKSKFLELPSDVREQYNNDPFLMLSAVKAGRDVVSEIVESKTRKSRKAVEKPVENLEGQDSNTVVEN